MLALIDADDRGLDAARALLEQRGGEVDLWAPLDAVEVLAPLPEPRQMRDAMTFELHYKQSIREMAKLRVGKAAGAFAVATGIARVPRIWYEQPTYYKCNRFSVIGTETDVLWPREAKLMDFECELGIVIGKTGKDIPRERAREHIFGYTIFNDFSARDEQTKEMAGQLGPGKGKDFDNANAMGPCLVTADEIGDPYRLTMICRVNGEEWGRGNSRDMHWKFEDCIAHASRSETLHAGEFFGSGTVGNGCGLEQMRFLKPGDVVELEVEGIGVLRNRVLR